VTNSEFLTYLSAFQAAATPTWEVPTTMDVEPLRFEPGYCWCVVGEYLVEVRHLAEISSCELRVARGGHGYSTGMGGRFLSPGHGQ
jgi:hypothetical protein